MSPLWVREGWKYRPDSILQSLLWIVQQKWDYCLASWKYVFSSKQLGCKNLSHPMVLTVCTFHSSLSFLSEILFQLFRVSPWVLYKPVLLYVNRPLGVALSLLDPLNNPSPRGPWSFRKPDSSSLSTFSCLRYFFKLLPPVHVAFYAILT